MSRRHWRLSLLVLIPLFLLFTALKHHQRPTQQPWKQPPPPTEKAAEKATKQAALNEPEPVEEVVSKKEEKNKYAYVFYITNDIYTCYAVANAERLVSKLNVNKTIDIVFITMSGTPVDKFCIEKCFKGQVITREVPVPPTLTDNKRYVHCYVRFEAFRLLEYARIIILDADGVVVQNLDHLFTMDLEGHQVAAGYTPNTERWLDSILIVARPSEELYRSVAVYMNKENISKVAEFANGAHFDMDLFNLVFQRGLRVKLLSHWYVMHDHQFNEGKFEPKQIREAYYVHYTAEKPFSIWEQKNWFQTQGFLSSLKGGFLYRTLWDEFDKHCWRIKSENKKVTLPMVQKDKGFYYPDPNEMLEYLQNNSDYLVLQKGKDISSED